MIIKKQKNKAFTLMELIFWLAIAAFIVGGFIYKRSNEIKKNPPINSQQANDKGGLLGNLKSETDNKQKLIQEN